MSSELLAYIKERIQLGPCSLEELQNIFLPVLEELIELHDLGLVSQELPNNIHVKDGVFSLKLKEGLPIKLNPEYLLKTFQSKFQFELLAQFKSPEIEAQQHDSLSDIFQIGLIFSSLALGLPLYGYESIQQFYNDIEFRKSIKENNSRILSDIIFGMTCLERESRTTDLRDISIKLQFADQLGHVNPDIRDVLKSFQNSLLDFSKKSNILFTKNSNHHVKLHQLNSLGFTPNEFLKQLVDNGIIEFHLKEENALLLNQLESLILQSRNDKKKIGFSSLKLALFNIHWSDLNSPDKPVQKSPLFFLPAKLSKTKDNSIQLKVISNDLETNPALSYHLRSKHNIHLPEALPLSDLTTSNTLSILNEASTKSNVPIVWENLNGNNVEFEDAFSWGIDQNFLVLGNYNYKKISLAKDYENILTNGLQSKSVSYLISNENEKIKPLSKIGYTPTDLFNIAPSDPYQDQAILQARKGANFVIQGPPGTGKSQTISNIIADFVARDKKVLFISSKRAALDTVYDKLKISGIENISALIHDAQNDKKDFIKSISEEYQERVKNVLNFQSIHNKRKALASDINQKINALESSFLQLKNKVTDSNKTSLSDLYKICLNDVGEIQKIESSIPEYYQWEINGEKYTSLYNKSKEANLSLPFRNHPFSYLPQKTWQKIAQQDTYEQALLSILSKGEKCHKYLTEIRPLNNRTEKIEDIDTFCKEIQNILLFSKDFSVSLLDTNSNDYKNLNVAIINQGKLEKQLAILKEESNIWKKKLSKAKLDKYINYLEIHKEERKLFFQAEYREMASKIFRRIKFPFYPSKKNIQYVLSVLKDEFQILKNIAKFEAQNIESFGTKDLTSLAERIKDNKEKISTENISLFNKFSNDNIELDRIKLFCEDWQIVREQLDYINFNVSESLFHYLGKIKVLLKDVITPPKIALTVSHFMDNSYEELFLNNTHRPEQLEKSFAVQTIEHFEKDISDFSKNSHKNKVKVSNELSALLHDLNKLNQHFIKAKQSDYFHQKLRFSSLSISGLNKEEKEKRKKLMNGVKVLEKEFSKSRNLKSIRELNESEAQEIIFDLKPVWLMSPLSVSEILPLQESLFDLIIFDEASQIGIEEAIPAIFRTNQCIIAGDKMQMPPSTFFKKNVNTTELIKTHESILHFAEKNWPSIELLWHYRSKNDDLILFNNTVFYNKKLQTIPNRKKGKNSTNFLEIRSINEAAFSYDKIRENPLGFHYIKDSIFENRRNEKEANYIAELVKHLLLSKKDLNLGIIALSCEQENAITQAIRKVKYFDKTFEELLQEKTESQDFFQDIFIKNLENIQGEERDLIIVSIGYGFDSQGKFSNNFGPINHQGGERRLNVLFSRAKNNLLLVSSIQHTDIKNSYNLGVNSLKDYLEFAEKYSRGAEANTITFGDHQETQKEIVKNQLIVSLKNAIEGKGYNVETNYGNSKFKIPLAVKKKGSIKKFALAILIDDSSFYKQPVHFSYAGKAEILTQVGWDTYTVISKNWYYEKDIILHEICTLLETESIKKKEQKEKQYAELNTLDYQLSINDLLFTRLETLDEPKRFWQIAGKLSDVVIQYGKIGKKGKTVVKSYSSVAEVIGKKRKLIKQKENKGYKRV